MRSNFHGGQLRRQPARDHYSIVRYLLELVEIALAAMWAHGYRRDLLQHKILAFGRYWRRHCAHLGRFQDFARDFPRAVDEQLRTR